MRVGGRLRGILARSTFAAATIVVLWVSFDEMRARLRPDAARTSALDRALAGDPTRRLARAEAWLGEGNVARAREEVRLALERRPRDPDALLMLAACATSLAERLHLAVVAAREAPYTVAPARFAFATAFEAVSARAPRAAAARESAARLVAAGVTDGVTSARSEAERLEAEMRACLGIALATYAATSPTARGMRFLDDARARAERLAAELEGP